MYIRIIQYQHWDDNADYNEHSDDMMNDDDYNDENDDVNNKVDDGNMLTTIHF